jgi:hypothetical protein
MSGFSVVISDILPGSATQWPPEGPRRVSANRSIVCCIQVSWSSDRNRRFASLLIKLYSTPYGRNEPGAARIWSTSSHVEVTSIPLQPYPHGNVAHEAFLAKGREECSIRECGARRNANVGYGTRLEFDYNARIWNAGL